MWGLQEADKIYKDKVKFYCRHFLCTAGAEQVSLRTGTISKEYSIPPLEADVYKRQEAWSVMLRRISVSADKAR